MNICNDDELKLKSLMDEELSDSTLKYLNEFYAERSILEDEFKNKHKLVEENWNLSQFWYDKETTSELTKEVLKIAEDFLSKNSSDKIFSIAFISCPTLYTNLYSLISDNKESDSIYSKLDLKLFEFDNRFEKFNDQDTQNFIFYDYNKPVDIDKKYKSKFHLVIADPPYIADECLIKTSMSIRYLLFNSNSELNEEDSSNKTCRKIIVCTGQLMKDLLEKCLNLKQCFNFEPKHERNLANEFRCYTNYEMKYYLS